MSEKSAGCGGEGGEEGREVEREREGERLDDVPGLVRSLEVLAVLCL